MALGKPQGEWFKIDQRGSGPGARSSHAITIVGEMAYVFGGEFTPRVPVDNNLYVFDLKEQRWSVIDTTGDVPPPRVGVTMATVGETIFVFGGRDAQHKELNELYSFDTSTNEWTLLSSTNNSSPPNRSYHSMTSYDSCLYVFGGCGESGRLNDLWAYDVVDKTWTIFPLPDKEDCKPRGGPGLVVAEGKIWVIYGFSGVEMDDVHYYDLADKKWVQVETTGEKPTARSVFPIVAIGKYIFVYGGEVDPSDLGHMGAGNFAEGVYVLDAETFVWTMWDDKSNSDDFPGPRGWCAFAAGVNRVGKPGLLIYGGNSPTNDRLDDIHFFTPYLD